MSLLFVHFSFYIVYVLVWVAVVSSASSFCLLLSILPSSPFLSSYVDEIRWFLLGEASVHPSAAPSCACPTPNNQVINKPANSHSSSITCCLCSSSTVLSVRPCPYAAPCELTASQHTDRPTHGPIHLSEKEACHRVFGQWLLEGLCWKRDNKNISKIKTCTKKIEGESCSSEITVALINHAMQCKNPAPGWLITFYSRIITFKVFDWKLLLFRMTY